MDFRLGLALGLPFAVGLAGLGAGIGLGRAVAAAVEAIGRQPESMTKVLIVLATGAAFIEAIAIYALVYAFVFGGKL